MVRLTGTIEIDGRRASLDWTISGEGIKDGPGLSSENVRVTVGSLAVAPSPTPTPETPVDAPAPVEPKSFEDMNKTELQVECSTRGLPTTGTKADLIERLTTNGEEGEAEAEPTTEGEGIGGESTSE